MCVAASPTNFVDPWGLFALMYYDHMYAGGGGSANDYISIGADKNSKSLTKNNVNGFVGAVGPALRFTGELSDSKVLSKTLPIIDAINTSVGINKINNDPSKSKTEKTILKVGKIGGYAGGTAAGIILTGVAMAAGLVTTGGAATPAAVAFGYAGGVAVDRVINTVAEIIANQFKKK